MYREEYLNQLMASGYNKTQAHRITKCSSENTIIKVIKNHNNLSKYLSKDQIVKMACGGGAQTIKEIQRSWPALTEQLKLSADQIVKMAAHFGGEQTIKEIQRASIC